MGVISPPDMGTGYPQNLQQIRVIGTKPAILDVGNCSVLYLVLRSKL